MLADSLLEQFVQSLAAAIWNRPELEKLRQPIEATLHSNSFRDLTQRAFQQLEPDELPYLLDEGYITMPAVQDALAAYIVQGEAANLGRLAQLYANRFLKPSDAPQIRPVLERYLKQLREVFATDETYGPILLAREMQVVVAGINNLQTDMASVQQMLRDLLAQPEIQEAVKQRKGRHIFLSYTRANLLAATNIRQALEEAGHTVWQDVTAIKGGIEWIRSIEDGIDRAYAVVSVVSHEAQESEWVTIEYLHAARREKNIVPIKIDGCEIPTMMLTRNVIHAHPEFQHGIEALLQAVPPQENETAPEPFSPDRRQLEIDYLDRVLLEHSVWQTVYTPMAGVGQMRVEDASDNQIEIAATGTQMEQLFDVFIDEAKLVPEREAEVKRENYEDILTAVQDMRQLVILGEPGSGKSTSLWRIAADYAEKAKADPSAPLPLILRLGSLSGRATIEDALRESLGELAPFYGNLLQEGRLALLLDGLNEMPAQNRSERIRQIKELTEQTQENDWILVISCRRLDYTGELNLGIREQVEITPLDPPRIRRFVNAYIAKPSGKGDELFWALAGSDSVRETWETWRRAGATLEQFWTAPDIPQENPNVWGVTSGEQDRIWREAVHSERSMMTLARNAYMLYMMTQIFARTGQLPENRGKLFESFVNFLLRQREKLAEATAETLKKSLAALGYEMQRVGEGTTFAASQVGRYLDDVQLYQAKSANILTGTDELRFSHQLLQEYFAAKYLDQRIFSPGDAEPLQAIDIWKPETWWEPTGWEETTILLAGLYSNDCTPVLNWLRDAQPELTARCMGESGSNIPEEITSALRNEWITRMTTPALEPNPVSRAAVGRAVSIIGDARQGVGVKEGLPDVDWVRIPGEDEWTYQAGKGHDLATFEISRYPVTYAQFQTFLDDPDGYRSQQYDWFEGLAANEDERQVHEQTFKYANHPRETVNWYQAVAFCRWWSWKLTGKIYALDEIAQWPVRLPTEYEWEKAARGNTGWTYPYGNEFDAAQGNTDETGIGRTSAVGMFPNGDSIYGVQDMSGNIWEWCLTDYSNPAEHPEAENLRSSSSRVLRGGSWVLSRQVARAGSRGPYLNSFDLFGIRVVFCSIQ